MLLESMRGRMGVGKPVEDAVDLPSSVFGPADGRDAAIAWVGFFLAPLPWEMKELHDRAADRNAVTYADDVTDLFAGLR